MFDYDAVYHDIYHVRSVISDALDEMDVDYSDLEKHINRADLVDVEELLSTALYTLKRYIGP